MYKRQDYERILALALRHMQMVRVDGTPYDLLAQEIVQHCPLTVKQRHPLALLRIAYHLHTCGLLSDYHQLMDELQGIIAQAPDQEQKALQGEWLLVDALGHREDLPILCAKLEQARRLLPGRSRVLDAWEPFALGVDLSLIHIYCAALLTPLDPQKTAGDIAFAPQGDGTFSYLFCKNATVCWLQTRNKETELLPLALALAEQM